MDTNPRVERATLAVRKESTYGSDAFGGAPVAADILPIENLEWEELGAFYRNPAMSGLLDHQPGVRGELMVVVRGQIWLRGRGTAYSGSNKPVEGPLYEISGASEAVDTTPSSEKVTYKWFKAPSPEHASASLIIMQENAPSIAVLGARATGRWIMVAGRYIVFAFEAMGVHGGRGTQALVTGAPSQSPIHPILAAAAFQIGPENFAAQFRDLTINLNSVVRGKPAPNAQNAYDGFFIGRNPDQPPTIELDPEAVTAATFDWFTKWGTGSLLDWSFQSTGGQYVRVKFGAAGNKAQISNLGWRARDGLRINPIVLDLLPSAGADSLIVTYD